MARVITESKCMDICVEIFVLILDTYRSSYEMCGLRTVFAARCTGHLVTVRNAGINDRFILRHPERLRARNHSKLLIIWMLRRRILGIMGDSRHRDPIIHWISSSHDWSLKYAPRSWSSWYFFRRNEFAITC